MRREDFMPPPPADEASFFRRAMIVLDTNVLLALYKLSAAARADALSAIEENVERLWLPHQVGVEFYRNHASHRDLRSGAYDEAIKQAEQFVRLATKPLGTGRTHEDLRKSVARVVSAAVEDIKKGIEELREADVAITSRDDDEVLERVEAAFEGRVAPAPDPTTIRERTEQFTNWRVPARIPPGYRDQGKPGTAQSAGDYLIWAEILEQASAKKVDVLFVTEDRKDDWWEEGDGPRRPHRALVLEFHQTVGSGRTYHQVSMEKFVRLATEATGDKADTETLDEIEAVNYETSVISSRVEEHLKNQMGHERAEEFLRGIRAYSEIPIPENARLRIYSASLSAEDADTDHHGDDQHRQDGRELGA